LHVLGFFRKRNNAKLELARELAQSGRHLAMFDRDTGLYAFWYLQRRFVEEAERATRYERPLSALVLEVRVRQQDEMTLWLVKNLRSCDIASHLGEGRYFLLLPETRADDAERLSHRIMTQFPTVRTGAATYVEDGVDYETLARAGAYRLSASNETAPEGKKARSAPPAQSRRESAKRPRH
jgi:GGDEF domain-containing protein